MTIDAPSSTTETDAKRTRAKRWWTIATAAILVGVVVLAIALSFPMRRFYAERAAVHTKARIQQAIIDDVKKLGGKLTYAASVSQQPIGFVTVDSVDLADTAADGSLLERLSRLTSIQRLNLDGTNIQGSDLNALVRLPNLQSLSLARTNVGDADLVSLARLPKLRTLSLHGTSISNGGIKQLMGITTLTNLDISQTLLTADGLQMLQGLPALQSVTLDERCITRESVPHLQSIKTLQRIELRVLSGLGKEKRELLSGNISVPIAACAMNGEQLWDATTPWDETLAGVVEAVVAEVSLDSQESDQLVKALSGGQFNRPINRPGRAGGAGQAGPEITSIDDFIRALHSATVPSDSMRSFARDKFTKNDVPKLLQAFRALNSYQDAERFHRYGSFLLVHHGLADPEAEHALDRMLNDADPTVRGITIYAFGRWGARPFYEDWIPSEKAAEFGVPRLLRFCDDQNATLRETAAEVLGDLTFHHPKYAPTVVPALLKVFKSQPHGYAPRALSRIAEVNKDAALEVLPELHRMLKNAETEVPGVYLTPTLPRHVGVNSYRRDLMNLICAIARFDPPSAKVIAADQLRMMRNGEAADGNSLSLVTLVSHQNPELARSIVKELLGIANIDDLRIARTARTTLVSIAIAIRDWRSKERPDAATP